MPPGQRQLAERRLLTALRRLHRREPMAPDIRTDTLIAALRDEATRPGAPALRLFDAELRGVIDELVARGELEREGRRVRLAGHRPRLGPEMRERADALLAELAGHGASPPRADAVARRLGVPPAVLDALRQSGELVELAPGIDYPRTVLDPLLQRLGEVTSVAQARDEVGTSRRYAAALLGAVEARRRR
jgi:hypothetical protein